MCRRRGAVGRTRRIWHAGWAGGGPTSTHERTTGIADRRDPAPRSRRPPHPAPQEEFPMCVTVTMRIPLLPGFVHSDALTAPWCRRSPAPGTPPGRDARRGGCGRRRSASCRGDRAPPAVSSGSAGGRAGCGTRAQEGSGEEVLPVQRRCCDQLLLVPGEEGIEHDLVLGLQGLLPSLVQPVRCPVGLGGVPQAVEETEEARHATGGEDDGVEAPAVVAEGVDLSPGERVLGRRTGLVGRCAVGVRGVRHRSPQGLVLEQRAEVVDLLELLGGQARDGEAHVDRKSTRLNSSHANISYAGFCLKKKTEPHATRSGLVLTITSTSSNFTTLPPPL